MIKQLNLETKEQSIPLFEVYATIKNRYTCGYPEITLDE